MFNTSLINLKLINDTYVFQRGDEANECIYFGVNYKKEGKDDIYLKNLNNKKTESFFITIDKNTKNNYYRITLKNNELSIVKIKKE
jgi:hypothetical protein